MSNVYCVRVQLYTVQVYNTSVLHIYRAYLYLNDGRKSLDDSRQKPVEILELHKLRCRSIKKSNFDEEYVCNWKTDVKCRMF